MQKEKKIKSKTDALSLLFTIVIYQEHISLPEGPGRCVMLITDYSTILTILAFVFPTTLSYLLFARDDRLFLLLPW